MSQGSLNLPTTGTLSGLALVNAINAALAAISSKTSGATDPATLTGGVQPFSYWADTSVTPNLLRMRNAANTAWILIGDLTQPAWGLATIAATQQGTYTSAVAGGTANLLTATISTTLTSLTNSQPFTLIAQMANTSATVTLAVTLGTTALSAYPIVKGANSPLVPNDIPGAGYPMLLNWSQAFGAYVLQNPANGIIAQGTTSPEVRQTVLQGVTNANGYANMLSAGSGLALNLSATAMPLRTAFAQGAADFIATLSADTTNVVTGLPANNLSYITQDYVSPTSVAWGSTLAPAQYGYSYNQAAQGLLHFNGSAGSTTILDDFGNVWSAQGGAKLQTNQTKFGSAALGGSGTSNALNGSTDYVVCNSITSLGSGSWSMRGYAYHTGLPGVGVFGAYNASGFGANLSITSAGKTSLSLSSNGTSNDIASNTLGTATVTTGSMIEYELTFDAVGGKYLLYVNGALDQTITSSLRICAITQMRVGAAVSSGSTGFMLGYIDEFEFLPYCDHPNGTAYAVPTSAPNIANPGYASDFFSIPNKTMYQVTGASATAGSNPTFTAKNRVYTAEATTGASTVSSVVNYAIQGKYDSGWTNSLPAASVVVNKNHYIGVVPDVKELHFKCITADAGYAVGDVVKGAVQASGISHIPSLPATSNGITFTQGASGGSIINKSSGGWVTPTTVNWAYRFTASRGW